MINTLLGQKIGMTQEFVDETRVPVTQITLGPCVVTQVKTEEKDGYNAIQIGYGSRKIKNVTKPLQGHLKGVIKEKKAPYFLREVEVSDPAGYKVGDTISIGEVFAVGDTVTVVGTTKGKGFAGAVKRWGFAGAPASHGHGGELRRVGSVGQGTSPGRVYKGKKMAGRLGNDRRSLGGMKVVSMDIEKNLININGPVPGSVKSYLMVVKTGGTPIETIIENKQEEIVEKQEESKENEN